MRLSLSPQSGIRNRKLPWFPVLSFILRFGLYHGLQFRRVAAKCDRDPHRLREWETHYRAIASRNFRHDNAAAGRIHLAFAEMLQTTRERLIHKRKARRALATRQNRKVERALARKRQLSPVSGLRYPK